MADERDNETRVAFVLFNPPPERPSLWARLRRLSSSVRSEWVPILKSAFVPTKWSIQILLSLLALYSTIGAIYDWPGRIPYLDFGAVIWLAIILISFLSSGFVSLALRVRAYESGRPINEESWWPAAISTLLTVVLIGAGACKHYLARPNPLNITHSYVAPVSWQIVPFFGRFKTACCEAITPANVAFYVRLYNDTDYEDSLNDCEASMLYNRSWKPLWAIPASALYWNADSNNVTSSTQLYFRIKDAENFSVSRDREIPPHESIFGFALFNYPKGTEVMKTPRWIDLTCQMASGRQYKARWDSSTKWDPNAQTGIMTAFSPPMDKVTGALPSFRWLVSSEDYWP